MLLLCVVVLLMLMGGCVLKDDIPVTQAADPVVFEAFVDTETSLDEAQMVDCPSAADARQYTRPKRPKASIQQASTPAQTPNAEPIFQPMAPGPVAKKPTKPVNLDTMISAANKAATITPTAEGYTNNRAIYRYRYSPEKVYTIPVNSAQFSKMYFPAGEKPVSKPTLSDDLWKLMDAWTGPPDRQQYILAARPVEDGLTAETSIDMASGRTYFLRFQANKTPMLGVTWLLPDGDDAEGSTTRDPRHACGANHLAQQMQMPVELARLFTAYRIETKGSPSFIPTQVFDDGRRTMVKFKPFTGNAPIVQVYKDNGEKGLVQFTPWEVPNDPSGMVYIIIENIWHKIVLLGTDGHEVLLIRLDEKVPVAQRRVS